MQKDYEINKKYAYEEYESIVEWWQEHKEYDINEIREPRTYIKKPIKEINPETGEEIVVGEEDVVEERDYNDYVEIVRRSDEMIVSTYREQRVELLNAFDKYKTNVQYGIEQETVREKEAIVQWYKDLLDLKSEAFIGVPEKIKYYI